MAYKTYGISSDFYSLNAILYDNGQNVAENSSTITYIIKCKDNINAPSYSFEFYVGKVVASQTSGACITSKTDSVTLVHDNDGSLRLRLYIKRDGTIEAEEYFDLPHISRISTLTFDASKYNIGDTVSITVNKKDSSFLDTVKVSYTAASQNYESTIATKTSGTNFTWTIPSTLTSQLTNQSSISITVSCTTYLNSSDSSLVGTTSTNIFAYVPEDIVPSITSVTSAMTNTGNLSSWGVYVKGYTNCKLTIKGAAGNTGSTISKYVYKQSTTATYSTATTLSESTSSTYTFKPSVSGDVTLYAYVIDSRGRTSKVVSTKINVKDYSPVTIGSLVAHRCDKNGNIDENGECARIAYTSSISEVGSNAIDSTNSSLKYRIITNTSWTDSSYNVTLSSATFKLEQEFGTTYKYEIQLTLQDLVGTTATKTVVLSTPGRIFNIAKYGNGLAIGKLSSITDQDKTSLFEVGWATSIEDALTVSKATTLNSTLSVAGAATFASTSTFTGKATFNGAVSFSSIPSSIVTKVNGTSASSNAVTIYGDGIKMSSSENTTVTGQLNTLGNRFNSYLPKTGGTLTGNLTLNSTLSTSNKALTNFITLLWNTAGTKTSFDAQTVTVTNAKYYDIFLIECLYSNGGYAFTQIFIPESNYTTMLTTNSFSTSFYRTVSRSGDSFTFGDCGSYNDHLIPIKIWGVNISISTSATGS